MRVLLGICVLAALALVSCDNSRIERLEARVTTLEERLKEQSEAAESRRSQLKWCVEIAAEKVYWDYVKLNAKERKDGSWWGPTWVWEDARQRKKDKVEECKLLYGD